MNKKIKIFLQKNKFTDSINESVANEIILVAIKKYLKKQISTSFISALADEILYEKFLNKNISIENLELSDTLDTISELKYNQKNSKDNFEKSIKILQIYLKNNANNLLK
ncbi:MAG: hypothetical protein PHO75_01835 [Candidatus Shapirobacteria bacterium]|nr:hypothetical protein [Candidatus Shapirobacteria bacterium]